MDNSFDERLKMFPEFLRSTDLIKLGLYGSFDTLYRARLEGNSPDFIRLKRKILYPKKSLIEFLERRLKNNILNYRPNCDSK